MYMYIYVCVCLLKDPFIKLIKVVNAVFNYNNNQTICGDVKTNLITCIIVIN